MDFKVDSYSVSELCDYVYHDLFTYFTKQASDEELRAEWEILSEFRQSIRKNGPNGK